MKHIYLDKCFFLFLIIIILTGSFNEFLPFFMLLLIHEMGHALTGVVLGYKLDKISFFPYGGVTSFYLPLNIPLKEELFILIMGPIMQVLGYFVLRNFFSNISIYHYTLLFFNLLPIYPLDGGKIMNIILCYSFNYLKSFYFTFWLSIMFIMLLLVYNFYHFNLNMILTIVVMMGKLLEVYRKRFIYYNRFLLERYLHHYGFRKTKSIHDIKEFYRDTKHFINFQSEEKTLKDYFQN